MGGGAPARGRTRRGDEADHGEERDVVAGPVDARALGAPEEAEARQHHSDRELDGVLGHARERRAHEHADDDDEHDRGRGARDGEAESPLRAPNVITMNATSSPSSRTPLNATVNPYQSSRPTRSPPPRSLLALPREDLVLVVQRLVAARAQDRLAQPLQPEREQQGADDEAQGRDRDELQRRPERSDDRRQRSDGGPDADQGRAPAANHADPEHDRQRLDHLDPAGKERSQESENV